MFRAVSLRPSDRGPGQQQCIWGKRRGRESVAGLGENRRGIRRRCKEGGAGYISVERGTSAWAGALRIGLIEDRFEYLSGKTLMKEEKVVQRYRFSAMKADASPTLTRLGTGQGTWGASHLQLTKLTTVQSPVQKRHAASVLPASLETFVAAIELLAERRRSCEVGLIGAGEGDTSFRRQDCLRARNRADQSGTRHSRSREEGLAKDRHRRIAVVAADVRYETWLGFGRPGSRISTQDHNTPGTGWHFCIGIANLEEDRGNV